MARFIEAIRSLELVGEAEIAAARDALASPKNLIPEVLAEELVRRKKLTRFQALNLCQDRAKYLLLGSYIVQDQIGAGGMGQVYLGRHRRLDRPVALKVLPKKALGTATAVDRFLREGRAAARLSHPNIVAVFDADEAGGVHFLAMEYVEGESLTQLVKRGGPVEVEKAVRYIVQAARGLAHAHAAGVVHRDVKPSNLLVDKSGTLKVLDLGLARLQDPLAEGTPAPDTQQDDLTQAGQIMGTIDYMAPEQAYDTRQTDGRADIYSLGCTLHFLLTGRPPFSGSSVMERLLKHREAPIPELPAASADVNAVFQKMMAKNPAERHQTMDEAAAALEHALWMRTATVALPPSVPATKGPGSSSLKLPSVVAPPPTPFPTAPPVASATSFPTAGSYPTATSIPAAASVGGQTGFPTVTTQAKGPASSTGAKSKRHGRVVVDVVEAAEPNRANKQIAPLVIVGAAIVALVVAAVIFFNRDNGADDTANKSPATSAATAASGTAATGSPATPVESTPDLPPPVGSSPGDTPTFFNTTPVATTPIPTAPVFGSRPTPISSPVRSPDEMLGPMKGVDLLKEIDLVVGPLKNFGWKRDATGVTMGVAPADNSGIIHVAAIDFAPPEEYILRAVVERVEGQGALALGFIAYGEQAFLRALDPTGVQLGPIDGGGWVGENETRVPYAGFATNGPWAIECRVATSGVTVTISDVQLIDWPGSAQRLAGGRGKWLPPNPCLFIGAHRTSRFRITRWELTTLAGDAPSPKSIAATPTTTAPPSTGTTTPPAVTRAKPAIPGTAEQAAALEQVKQLLRKEFGLATRPDGKRPLIETLLRTADVTEDDPVSRYVMLAEARDRAIELGDLDCVAWAVEEISWAYDAELPVLYAPVYDKLSQLKLTAPLHHRVAEEAMRQSEATQDWAVARSLAQSAVDSARKSQDVNLVRRTVEFEKQAAENLAAWQAAEQARAKLTTAPDDAAAHLALGRFLCFVDDRAEEGCGHLVRGGDALLSDLARTTLDAGPDSAKQLDAARAWRDAAAALKTKEQEPLRQTLEEFAKRRYRELLPKLAPNSLPQRAARQELDQLEALGLPRPTRPPVAGEPDRSFASGLLSANTPTRVLHTVTVQVDGQGTTVVRDAAALPKVPFTITEVALGDLQTQPVGPVFAQLAPLRGLKKLTLNVPTLADADVQYLSSLGSLAELYFTNTPNLTDAALPSLRPLRQLLQLTLSSTKVGDAGLINLRGLTSLERLELRQTTVSDSGLIHLKGMKNLRNLNVQVTNVTPDGAARITKQIPQCRVALGK